MTEGHDITPSRAIHDRIRDQEIVRERGSLPEERAAPANRHPEQVIQLWLIDTGCGHDLVSRRELAAVKDMVRKAQQTIILHTANGKVVARDAIDLFVKE